MKLFLLCLAASAAAAADSDWTKLQPRNIFRDGGDWSDLEPRSSNRAEVDICASEGVTDTEGTITSPNYPENYPANSDCSLTLEAPAGGNITVSCTAFRTQGCRRRARDYLRITANDELQVTEGNNELELDDDEYVMCGRFRRRQLPAMVFTSGDRLTLEFVSDRRRQFSGFSCDYLIQGDDSTGSSSSSCSESSDSGSGSGSGSGSESGSGGGSGGSGSGSGGGSGGSGSGSGGGSGGSGSGSGGGSGGSGSGSGGGSGGSGSGSGGGSGGSGSGSGGGSGGSESGSGGGSGGGSGSGSGGGSGGSGSGSGGGSGGSGSGSGGGGGGSDGTCGISSTSTRIVGGERAEIEEYPWMAALQFCRGNSCWFCGGSVISDRWILSVAHCTQGATSVTARLGGTELNSPHQTVTSSSIFTHPQYDNSRLLNDIGLVQLPSALTFSDKIRPVCLPSSSDGDFSGQSGQVSGWGRFSDSSGSISSFLRDVTVPIMSNAQCTFWRPPTTQMCVNTTGGKSSCNGDSGGPLQVRQSDNSFLQVGVVSYGSRAGCEVGHPAAFTRVTEYLSYIEGVTGISLT